MSQMVDHVCFQLEYCHSFRSGRTGKMRLNTVCMHSDAYHLCYILYFWSANGKNEIRYLFSLMLKQNLGSLCFSCTRKP